MDRKLLATLSPKQRSRKIVPEPDHARAGAHPLHRSESGSSAGARGPRFGCAFIRYNKRGGSDRCARGRQPPGRGVLRTSEPAPGSATVCAHGVCITPRFAL